jgi:hypothetical protein
MTKYIVTYTENTQEYDPPYDSHGTGEYLTVSHNSFKEFPDSESLRAFIIQCSRNSSDSKTDVRIWEVRELKYSVETVIKF